VVNYSSAEDVAFGEIMPSKRVMGGAAVLDRDYQLRILMIMMVVGTGNGNTGAHSRDSSAAAHHESEMDQAVGGPGCLHFTPHLT
jgi:hypothetical protein